MLNLNSLYLQVVNFGLDCIAQLLNNCLADLGIEVFV